MLIFLDDVRTVDYMDRGRFKGLEHYPVSVVRSAKEAIELVRTGKVEGISFDHDLGSKLTGLDVAKTIEYLVAAGKIKCPKWAVHSANPIGARNIADAMRSAERFELENS